MMLSREAALLINEDGTHVHGTRENVDRDEAALCTDPNCRHAGQFLRHSRRCPSHHELPCDFMIEHARECRCAECDPAFAASCPPWNEHQNSYTFEKAKLRADAQRGFAGENSRDRFLRLQAEAQAAHAAYEGPGA